MPLIICNELGIDENTLRRTLIEDEKENFYVFEIKSFVNEPLFEYQLVVKKMDDKGKISPPYFSRNYTRESYAKETFYDIEVFHTL